MVWWLGAALAVGVVARDEGIDPDVAHFVSQMTLEEKIGQMTQLDIGMVLNSDDELDADKLKNATLFFVGSLLNTPFTERSSKKPGFTASEWEVLIQQIQDFFIKNTRLAIPILYGLDSVHGANYVYGATLFPHNTGIAASFNLTLAQLAAATNAQETRAANVDWAFGPDLDIGFQPLWPRFYETFGEDPFIASQFARVMVNGLQGERLSAGNSVAACAKHFFGYPAPRSGKDRTDAWIPDAYLKDYFLPSFREAVKYNVSTIMINSGSINGVPAHASKKILTDILRDELGFKGVAVTDWADIEKLVDQYAIACNNKDAVRIAIEAGVDMSMVPSDFTFPVLLKELVQEGTIKEDRIDLSTGRIMQLKKNLGLFIPSQPNAYKLRNAERARKVPPAWDVSLELARQSLTLLKNDQGVLPLPRQNLSVLLTGPAANSIVALCGGWTFHWQGAGSEEEFTHGGSIADGVKKVVPGVKLSVVNIASFTDSNATELAAAKARAAQVEVIILAVGEGPEAETPGNIDDLTISTSQLELYEAVRNGSRGRVPIITVVVSARPRLLGPIAQGSEGLLMAYLPCSEGGQAIAEALFGYLNPAGRLPFTYPRTSGDLDVYYHKPYGGSSHRPLFEFGSGLSYTTFSYSNISLSPASEGLVHPESTSRATVVLRAGAKAQNPARLVPLERLNGVQAVRVSLSVTNNGTRAGEHTVLVYLKQQCRSTITPEVHRLRGFSKVALVPKASHVVSLVLEADAFSYVQPDGTSVVESGNYTVQAGDKTAAITLELFQ